ncbi:MAG: amidohydrolase family protein [Chloroflexi bacterium]|jgi:predicted TIM-barrel fold metal-dependent hydrolase|nr:amidohydrolase family protein [Chloroflexota bacterium]MBT4073512.1 amidohydrolase family protein [Chloroflexota bacterium]MBT4515115.1 amidohydrolase family protein [Chloroflexota bacterium]MBT6682834.1 amidohydrolase family protein [Chloroflexota bacterium]
MKIIDTHHHLWDLDNNSYPWLQTPIDHFAGDYSKIRRTYLIGDLIADASEGPYELVKSVHVQAEWDHEADPVGETAWLQGVANSAEANGLVSAIVGNADFFSPEVEAVLERHAAHPNFRGIRQMLNHSQDNAGLNFIDRGDAMDDPTWREGYRLLAKFDASFDLQVWPWQLEMSARLANDIPEVPIILNHTGMPFANNAASRRQWGAGMRAMATAGNVSVKISALGMATPGWTADDIRPYVEDTIDIFGVDRCMFASNFPVDSLTSDYTSIWAAYDEITSGMSDADRKKLFHDNAVRYYRL